jgi:hypothetical protein
MMANDPEVKPGARIRCADGAGVALIVRKASNTAFLFLPSLRTYRWIDTTKLQPARRETKS